MTENERREFLKVALAAMGGVAGAGVLGCRMAMCYVPAPRMPELVPCPECKLTMIPGQKDEILSKYNIALKRIQNQGIDAKLIIPGHCPECGFGLKEAKFQLEIQYADRPELTRIELESASDLEDLSLTLQKKTQQ